MKKLIPAALVTLLVVTSSSTAFAHCGGRGMAYGYGGGYQQTGYQQAVYQQTQAVLQPRYATCEIEDCTEIDLHVHDGDIYLPGYSGEISAWSEGYGYGYGYGCYGRGFCWYY